MSTLALIDGHSIAYRAFYALPKDLATSSGQVTNAVFGFTRMLIRLLADEQPEALAVVWDVSRQTFRTNCIPSTRPSGLALPTCSLHSSRFSRTSSRPWRCRSFERRASKPMT